MFGYIKPAKAELKVKEWEAYQGIYCGLCKQLARRYGWFARMTLNYDFVFLAVLDMALREKQIHFCREHCVVHPLKKRTCCRPNESLELCCDVAMLLTCHKLEDDLHDEGFLKRTMVRLILPFARRDYRKAAAFRPELAQKLREQMQRQQQLEDGHCANVDQAAEPTACLMGQVLSSLSEDPMRRRVLERLGYLLGRFVYLIDALDDWDEDTAKGRYNPFAERAAQKGAGKDWRRHGGVSRNGGGLQTGQPARVANGGGTCRNRPEFQGGGSGSAFGMGGQIAYRT